MWLIGKLLMTALTGMSISSLAGAADYPRMSTPLTDPSSWITSADYPGDALRAGRSGRVVIAVGVDKNGKVASCTVTVSSSTASLDTKTCELIERRARFSPAVSNQGVAIASTYLTAISWKIPMGDPIPVQPGQETRVQFESELVIGTDGMVKTCRLVEPASEPVYDICQDAPPGTKTGPGYTQDGKPVEAIVRLRIEQTTRFRAPTP